MRKIEYIPDIIEQVEKLFEHGHSRAKNHDQRLGQWIVNKIRTDNFSINHRTWSDADIVRHLFNIENREFLDLVGDYNK